MPSRPHTWRPCGFFANPTLTATKGLMASSEGGGSPLLNHDWIRLAEISARPHTINHLGALPIANRG